MFQDADEAQMAYRVLLRFKPEAPELVFLAGLKTALNRIEDMA